VFANPEHAPVQAGPPDPVELVRRIGRGDATAEHELVGWYGPRLAFMLRRRTGDPALAEDLRQETLIVVLTRLREEPLDDPGKLSAFLHQTALNLLRGEFRKRDRRQTHTDLEQVVRTSNCEALIEDRIDHAALSRAVRQLLSQLRQPRDRQILRRFYLTEEPKESIRRSLGVSSAHFDRVLYRARQRFADLLREQLDQEYWPD